MILLAQLRSLGQNISKIAGLNIEQLQAQLKQLGSHVEEVPRQLPSAISISNPKLVLDNLMMALLNYKLDILSHELAKFQMLLSPRQWVFEILEPLLQEVGIEVEKRKLSISQEHALSSLLKFHIGAVLFRKFTPKYGEQKTIILATPETEFHDFGIIQAALLCCHHKIRFIYLGPNLPVDSLIDAYHSIKPEAVILGTTSVLDLKSNFLHDYVSKLLIQLDKRNTPLILGGPAKIDYKQFEAHSNLNIFRSFRQLDEYLQRF